MNKQEYKTILKKINNDIKLLLSQRDAIIDDLINSKDIDINDKFDLWYELYQNKNDYDFYSKIPKPLSEFINNFLHSKRYDKITIDQIKKKLYEMEMENIIDNTYINIIKKECIKSNFNSVIIDW